MTGCKAEIKSWWMFQSWTWGGKLLMGCAKKKSEIHVTGLWLLPTNMFLARIYTLFFFFNTMLRKSIFSPIVTLRNLCKVIKV